MKEFTAHVKELTGINLSEEQYSSFKLIGENLQDWNQRINLTAIDDDQGIWIKHFLDSISCLNVISGKAAGKVIDVGTGAGFPGIPLKVMLPQIQLTLLESIGKKITYLQHLSAELQLQDVHFVNQRAEDAASKPEHREQYDWAVARAVARLPVLVEYLLPFVKIGGCMLAQKGGSGPSEVQQAQEAIDVLGGELVKIQQVALPGVVEERNLVVIKKVAASPEKYPRRAGVPSKRPIGV